MTNYGLFLYTTLSTGERFEILKRDYQGAAHEIKKLAGFEFRPLDNDSAEVTDLPIIKSSLSLDITDMGDFDYSMFFTTDATLWRVMLKINDKMEWSGYVTPESYSSNSEYRSSINLIARDNLGQLEQIDYNWFEFDYVSFYQLLDKACDLIGWNFPRPVLNAGLEASDGTIIEQATMNVESFRDKTWWDVLSDILTSFGCQLSFQGDAMWVVDNVSLAAAKGEVVDRTAWHTIGGGMTTEIIPSWREMNLKQDFQKLDNFFGDFMRNEWYVFTRETRYIKSWNNKSGTGVDNSNNPAFEFKVYRLGGKWINTYDQESSFPLLIALKQDNRDNAVYISGGLHSVGEFNPSDTGHAYREYVVEKGLSAKFEISVNNQLFAPIVTENETGQLEFIDDMGSVRTPSGGEYVCRFKFAVLSESEDGTKLYLHDKTWKSELKIIELDATRPYLSVWPKGKDDTFTIIAQDVPSKGKIQLIIFRPLYYGLASTERQFDRHWFFKFNSIKASIIAETEQEKQGVSEIRAIITPSARDKRDIDLLYGELPAWSNSLMYAGGLFKGNAYHTPLVGWHRRDNLGGVLPLHELVGRAYALNFNGFRTTSGEPTGGKILRGKFPVKGIKLGNVVKIGVELYVINSIAYQDGFSMADLTLRQVRRYTHDNYSFTVAVVDAGGGSVIGGGGNNIITWMNSESGGGSIDISKKRTYELAEIADSEIANAVMLVDMQGAANALKIKTSKFARLNGDSNVDFAAKDITAHSVMADKVVAVDVTADNIEARIIRAIERLIAGEIVSTDFVSGLLGDGFKIDANGNAEFGSLMLRTFLMTPELIKNRIRTVSGDVWFSDSAVVSAAADPVFALTAASGARIVDSAGRQLTTTYRGYYHIAVRDSEGKPLMTFAVDDILRGIYSYEDGTFSTVFLRVTTALRGSYLVRPLNGLAPAADMVLVRQGNYTNPLRQNAVYVSAMEGYVRVLGGVNDVTISLSNIKAQAGNLRGLHLLGVDNMPPDGLYAPGLVIHSSSVLGLDTTLSATADKLALQGETITAQARQIALKADLITLDAYVLSTGIFESTGLIKAALINVDSLVAKSIDTRINGRWSKGVVIDRGANIITVYDNTGIPTVKIYEGGDTNMPTLSLERSGFDIWMSPTGLSIGDNEGRRSEYLANGINMPSTARMNMPGVLAAGHVEKDDGIITGQWGCKTCYGVKYNNQVGQYKITHSIGHLEYYVTATPVISNWRQVHAMILEKTATYVVIAMCDSVNGNFGDCDFEFMICGKN